MHSRSASPTSLSLSRYQADFRPADLFDAGPSGYDAMFSLEPGAGDGMPRRTFARPVEVQITGSILTYDIADPLGGKGEPVKALAAQFPDMRRFIREGYVRYAFTRFGVPYVVSIQCLDSSARARRLACREAYPVAERFPESAAHRRRPAVAAAPRSFPPTSPSGRRQVSPDFIYRPSGDIIANSGSRKQGGRADLTAYSQIRFPLEKTPAFVRSQSFGQARQDLDGARRPIHGGIISAKRAVLRSASAPAVSAIRGRTSGPAPARRSSESPSAAIPNSGRSSRSATAS